MAIFQMESSLLLSLSAENAQLHTMSLEASETCPLSHLIPSKI